MPAASMKFLLRVKRMGIDSKLDFSKESEVKMTVDINALKSNEELKCNVPVQANCPQYHYTIHGGYGTSKYRDI